jgi:uncharacterized protein
MPSGPLANFLAEMKLVDGHCHCVLAGPPDLDRFERAATEADAPLPRGLSYLDGAVGLAIRRWCAPVLDLSAGVPITEYLDRRRQLDPHTVARRMLRAAGLSHLLVDTGLAASELLDPGQLGTLADAQVREVVRLERVAERVAGEGASATGFASSFVAALDQASRNAVSVKSIVAYRGGFPLDPSPPSAAEVREAAGRWLSRAGPIRMDDPVLLRFLLWCGVDRGLPIQIHAGFGDRDLALARADPALLQPFLAATEAAGVPVVLLHCYPYHRQAGWLAQVYPHAYIDFGLTVAQLGARSEVILGEFLELAPFGKVLFSTDGYALPELYLVGAAQFRHSLAKLLAAWVSDGAMGPDDAQRLAELVGSINATRLYRL